MARRRPGEAAEEQPDYKAARDLGYKTGYSIAEGNAEESVEEVLEVYEDDAGNRIFIGDAEAAKEKIVSDATETESEHYRQFSPFEFTAKEFNESADPDGMWSAYDEGVAAGAEAAAEKWASAHRREDVDVFE